MLKRRFTRSDGLFCVIEEASDAKNNPPPKKYTVSLTVETSADAAVAVFHDVRAMKQVAQFMIEAVEFFESRMV